MVIGLALCPICKPRSPKPLESRRATITKDVGATVEGSQKLKFADEAVVAEDDAMIGVAGAEAEVAGTPMDRS